MADIVVSQQVTKEEIVEAYDKGLHIQALADKYNLSVDTVSAIVNEAFPQDVDGQDIPVVQIPEGQNPEVAVATTDTNKGEVTSTKNQKV